MNSLNHWALGAVGEWMMKVIGGLSPGGRQGWTHPVIRPLPGGALTWAQASYDSVRGMIKCSWRLHRAGLSMNVTVPVGTIATVHVPCHPGAVVSADGGRLLSREPEAWVYEVGSGTYAFVVRESGSPASR
jgi:alpha-L-rhamnosidase